MRPRVALLALLVALAAACEHVAAPESRSTSTAHGDDTFVVMTFNVRYGTADDGADAWPNRRDDLLAVIRDATPALLGVQEALDFQVDWLAAGLPNFQVVGQGRDGGREGEYAALFVDRTCFVVLESGDFWLSERPDAVGSVGWDAALPRVCTWARVRDVRSARELTIWNTHFDHRGARARVNSAELVAKRVAQRSGARIVIGDLNAGEHSAPLQRLRDSGLRDSFRALHPDAGEVGTFHAFQGRRTGEKIDHVLASAELVPRAAEIVNSPSADCRWPSDHFPVTATFSWEWPGSALPPRRSDSQGADSR